MKILLAHRHEYLTANNIALKLSNMFEEEFNSRNIGNYIRTLENEFIDIDIESITGQDGGYKLTDDCAKSMTRLVTLALNRDQRNALNDSFELASRATNYHYTEDLNEAKDFLYKKIHLKDNDFEYYTGKRNQNNDVTDVLKKIKKAAMENHYIIASAKHEYFGIPTEKTKYKPLYIIHDPDETFIILRDKNGKDHYQNLLNIKDLEVLDNKFSLTHRPKIDQFKNDYTIAKKKQHEIKFTICEPKGHSIFELWNYEFEDLNPNSENNKHIKFYEEYKFHEFMLRIQPYIKITQIDDIIKQKWNNIANRIKKIK